MSDKEEAKPISPNLDEEEPGKEEDIEKPIDQSELSEEGYDYVYGEPVIQEIGLEEDEEDEGEGYVTGAVPPNIIQQHLETSTPLLGKKPFLALFIILAGVLFSIVSIFLLMPTLTTFGTKPTSMSINIGGRVWSYGLSGHNTSSIWSEVIGEIEGMGSNENIVTINPGRDGEFHENLLKNANITKAIRMNYYYGGNSTEDMESTVTNTEIQLFEPDIISITKPQFPELKIGFVEMEENVDLIEQAKRGERILDEGEIDILIFEYLNKPEPSGFRGAQVYKEKFMIFGMGNLIGNLDGKPAYYLTVMANIQMLLIEGKWTALQLKVLPLLWDSNRLKLPDPSQIKEVKESINNPNDPQMIKFVTQNRYLVSDYDRFL